MKSKHAFSFVIVVIILWITIYSCSKIYIKHDFRKNYRTFNDTLHVNIPDSSFFKIHLKNGDVSLLGDWKLNSDKDTIYGEGKLFDFNRNIISEGKLSFPLDDIAIVETNQFDAIKGKDKEKIAALSILTGINILGDVICITNPKACFGSCPTFYLNNASVFQSAHAEGFSSSISPSLEKQDLDALRYSTSSEIINITMKNEAYETHMINELFIQAVPKHPTDYVFHDKSNIFYRCKNLINVTNAKEGDKDISSFINNFDDFEYFSSTNSSDLSAKEEIYIEFDKAAFKNPGLVINFRQTLLTTFLLYNGLSYMGNEVGDYFAKIETNDQIKKHISNPFNYLGKIKLLYLDTKINNWTLFDELYETGPIAKNLMIAPLTEIPDIKNKIKIKIEMTKGLWRLDYLGLTSIQDSITAISIYPDQMIANKKDKNTIDAIFNDDNNYLVTFPGDEYEFKFRLPKLSDNRQYELFLSSKGYYLEWIRQNWIENKNLPKLKKMLLNDEKVWTELAKEFKEIEPDIEQLFWSSKYENCN
ncbi:hypothetical protein [Snuella lapsa]|uniref:Uncharacterized protein n=1 Tax=Snuella lapsa TaxID=870481 RepID=A0ABP6X5M5_9FLAO